MRTIFRLAFFAAALFASGKAWGDAEANWPTTQPAAVAIGQADAIYCPDMRSFLQALQTARRTPNTHIKLAPVEYHVTSEIIINGDGTTIDGNGATLSSTAYYSGAIDPMTGEPTTGSVLVVEPFLGKPVPFAKQSGGLWLNPPHTSETLNKAAGGTFQTFLERSPCQDASGQMMAKYSQFAPYLVPARNITIENVKVKFATRLGDCAIGMKYSQNVLVKNLQVLNMPADLGKASGHGDLWSDGSQWVTFDGCVGPTGIQMNSSLWCRVVNCKALCSTYEEGCRFCVTEKCTLNTCRTNDILCTDITFDGNTFVGTGDNVGCLCGGTRILFTNNTVHGGVWLERNNTRQCVIKGNHGPVFVDFAAKNAGNVIGPNP